MERTQHAAFGLYVNVDKSVSMIRMTAQLFSLMHHANELLARLHFQDSKMFARARFSRYDDW